MFLFSEDRFKKPNPFSGDIVVGIDDVIEKKLAVVEALESQFYEGGCCDVPAGGLPTDAAGQERAHRSQVRDRVRRALRRDRRPLPLPAGRVVRAASGRPAIRHAEAFEICEYGRQPSREEIRQLFPFFP